MAATYNITINQNTDFRRSFQVKEDDIILDITNYSFSGRLKSSFNSTTHVDFATSVTDGPAGTFSILLTDTVTADMDPGTWVYDIIMTDAALDKTRLIQGNAFVKQGVTP